LKKEVSAAELFAELGFEAVNAELLRAVGYEISESRLEGAFSDFAASIKPLGDFVNDHNALKNR
jgi:hypothetical protein